MLRYCAVVLTLLALFIASPSASAACTAAWSRWSSATSYRAPGRQFWVRYPHQLFHVPRLIPLEHASRAAKKDNKIPDDLQTKDLFRLMPLELKPLELELKRFERELELKPLERAPLDAKIYNKIPDDLQTMLEKAEQFELLSISPYPPQREARGRLSWLGGARQDDGEGCGGPQEACRCLQEGRRSQRGNHSGLFQPAPRHPGDP